MQELILLSCLFQHYFCEVDWILNACPQEIWPAKFNTNVFYDWKHPINDKSAIYEIWKIDRIEPILVHNFMIQRSFVGNINFFKINIGLEQNTSNDLRISSGFEIDKDGPNLPWLHFI